ncbi:type II CAAX prenyl endopeptidase Rce1 family protein [Nocardiopsis sp. MG754419]|uniref:CPBP family glutamic-type intramembrane protease n=1 Tax=Nocardiopsis sp. MG754419 TaxID=2259865 RepID=UPI001BAC5260|nr:CPBP family glutamic-type intramembrane protease [Nocardiopsis sp. MG754419]
MTKRSALLRALAGWATMFLVQGLAIALARRVSDWTADSVAVQYWTQAVLVAALVVPAILLLRSRVDRRSAAGMGWARPFGGAVAIGAGVALVSALVVWGPALLAGWITVGRVDPVQILVFLLVNTIVLVLYEALPEEIALRGYAWTNMRDGWGPAMATVVVTALFPVGVALSDACRLVVETVLGGDPDPYSAVPEGTDPLVYVVQLTLFGLALVAARRLPLAGALGAAIAFHTVQLTVNRLILGGTVLVDSGVEVTMAAPEVMALVFVHIVLGGSFFVGLRMVLPDARREVPRRSAA